MSARHHHGSTESELIGPDFLQKIQIAVYALLAAAVAAVLVALMKARTSWLLTVTAAGLAAWWWTERSWWPWISLITATTIMHRLIVAATGYGPLLMLFVGTPSCLLVPTNLLVVGALMVACVAGSCWWGALEIRHRGGWAAVRAVFTDPPADAYDGSEYSSELAPHLN